MTSAAPGTSTNETAVPFPSRTADTTVEERRFSAAFATDMIACFQPPWMAGARSFHKCLARRFLSRHRATEIAREDSPVRQIEAQGWRVKSL